MNTKNIREIETPALHKKLIKEGKMTWSESQRLIRETELRIGLDKEDKDDNFDTYIQAGQILEESINRSLLDN